MRHISIPILVFLTCVVLSASPATAACSNASLTGTYGILATGLNGSLQPASSLDQVSVDGAGHFTGTSTKSSDGSIVTYSFKGTYSIAANCTGSGTFTNQSNQVEHYQIVLNNVGTGGLALGGFLIQTDSTRVQSSLALAQGTATCTNLGVKQTYAFEATGSIIGTGQIAAVGQLTLNGTGGITGRETLSLNGTIHSSVVVSGSYKINSNCTGSATFTPSGLTALHFNLVVVNGGKEIMALQTDKNSIVTGTFQE